MRAKAAVLYGANQPLEADAQRTLDEDGSTPSSTRAGDGLFKSLKLRITSYQGGGAETVETVHAAISSASQLQPASHVGRRTTGA